MASDGRLGRECYGAIPHFPMNTIWFEHIDVDEDHPPTFDLNWEDPYFKIVLALHHAVLKEAGKDNFLVGQGCFMPGNDMLALVIGTQEMLTSMHDRPEWTRNAILQLARNWLTRCFSAMTGRSNSGWMAALSRSTGKQPRHRRCAHHCIRGRKRQTRSADRPWNQQRRGLGHLPEV